MVVFNLLRTIKEKNRCLKWKIPHRSVGLSSVSSRREYVGYAEINKVFKGIMNLRFLAPSAQAPQRSNGNDFPHNAPRSERGGSWGTCKGAGG